MKIEKLISESSIALLAVFSAQAQGTFQNLDFEQANPISTGTPNVVTAASALPGWTVVIDGIQQTVVGYDFLSTGGPGVSLIGPGFGPLDGNYSVSMTGSFPASIPSISQIGTIPAGAQSLVFEGQKGSRAGGNGSLVVMIGTQTIPIIPVAIEPSYTLYEANISAWAGDTEELTFSALEDPSGLNIWTIDDISFSPTAVTPEPSPLVLTGIGGILFAMYCRFAPKRK
jgi:hypothetical protein